MKKGIKLTLASAMAVSALTPAAVFADETPASATTGFYTANSFTTPLEYRDLPLAEKQALLAKEDLVLVVNGVVYFAKDALGKSDAELAEIAMTEAEFEAEHGELTESGYNSEATTELAVESVSAINPTTVKVTFNTELPADFDTSKLKIEGLKITNVSFEGATATVKVSGAEYGKSYNVHFDGESVENVKFGDVSEYFTLVIETDAKDENGNTIPEIEATGATTMQLTAYVQDNDTKEKVALDGAVQFLVTNGALGQNQVVLQDGKASVQLRSVSSLETVYSDITAVVVTNNELSGLTGSLKVEFAPKLEEGVEENAVNVIKVQTERADRLEIVLDKPKAALTKEELTKVKEALKITNDVKDERYPEILEVRQINDRILEVILDTYDESVSSTTGKYSQAHTATNFLDDNKVHNIVVTKEVKNILLTTKVEDKEKLNFKLTDSTQQFALGAQGLDQRTIEVRFSEPVVTEKTTTTKTGDLNAFKPENYVLDGKRLTDADVESIDLKKDPKTGKVLDEGKTVVIKLQGNAIIKEESLILQVRNIGDWSSVTNPVNAISTQDLFLNTTLDQSKPTVSFERQSPEQYYLEFDKPVYATSSDLKKLIDVRYGEVLTEDDKDNDLKKGDLANAFDLVHNTDKDNVVVDGTKNQVVVTFLDEDGEIVSDITKSTAPIVGILVELTKDWEKINNKLGFWEYSPNVQFIFEQNAFSTDLGNKNIYTNQKVANNVQDFVSPTVTKFEQLTKEIDEKEVLDDKVEVTFSEPVQIPSDIDKQGSGVPNTPNSSQAAKNDDKVQAPVIEFSKNGVTVKGEVSNPSIGDYTLNLQAVDEAGNEGFAALKAAVKAENDKRKDADENWKEEDAIKVEGTWMVTITGVSDDYGNTMATSAHEFIVPGEGIAPADKPLSIDPFVVYAELETPANGAFDIITVKFSEVMTNKDSRGVGLVANYIINSKELSTVTGAEITRGIAGVTNDWDGVTITVPKGEIVSADFMLTVASNVISADNQQLTGENKLSFSKVDAKGDKASAYIPKLLFTNDLGLEIENLLDAVIVEGGFTVADYKENKEDKEKYATGLTAEIEFTDAVVMKGLDEKDVEKNLQIMINGKVVKATFSGTDTQTIEIDADDVKDLKIKEGDRIELKVNGQTIIVGNTSESGVDAGKATPTEIAVLTDAVTAATTTHDNAAEGTAPGEYAVGSKATLQTAIDAADAVAKTADVTKAAIDQAVADLAAAVSTFENGKVAPATPATPTEIAVLTDAVTAATTTHDNAAEGTAAGEYAVGSKATLQTAIDAADAVAKTADVTKAAIDQAVADLAAAVSSFENGKVA